MTAFEVKSHEVKIFILTAKPNGFSHLVLLIASHILENFYTQEKAFLKIRSDSGRHF